MTAKQNTSEDECINSVQAGPEADSDEHIGAVEGDQPSDCHQGNRNAPALDDQGLPNDPIAIAEDVAGANADETEG